MLIKWLDRSRQICMSIELKMVSMLCTHSSIFVMYMLFLCMFLDLHLTMYHSNPVLFKFIVCFPAYIFLGENGDNPKP